MQTPWGKSDYRKDYGEGVTFYGTPSHGGFFVFKPLNDAMPAALRQDSQWYEEDCEYSKVMIAFHERFTAKEVASATETLRNWFPAQYEQHFGVTLQAGESYIRDRETFTHENAHNWVVTAAWGYPHNGVPVDYVGVVARLGGHDGGSEAERWFYIPALEYSKRNTHGFVIDTTRHLEAPAEFGGAAA